MSRAVNALQNFGKSLFGPVLILPIVGLFIAFGNIFGNGNLVVLHRSQRQTSHVTFNVICF